MFQTTTRLCLCPRIPYTRAPVRTPDALPGRVLQVLGPAVFTAAGNKGPRFVPRITLALALALAGIVT